MYFIPCPKRPIYHGPNILGWWPMAQTSVSQTSVAQMSVSGHLSVHNNNTEPDRQSEPNTVHNVMQYCTLFLWLQNFIALVKY